MASLNSGHGHVWPRPDGFKARCGGPTLCPQCRADQTKVLIIQISAMRSAPLQYVIFQDNPRVPDLIGYLNAHAIQC